MGRRRKDSTKETTRTRRTDMIKRSWFSQHRQSLTGWKSWMTISVIWTRILVPTGVPVGPTTEDKNFKANIMGTFFGCSSSEASRYPFYNRYKLNTKLSHQNS